MGGRKPQSEDERERRRDEKSIHVVAGVIVDARGRILLARRTEGRDLAGLWEFPGGTVDPGETPEQALVRELREELGIDAEVGEPVIVVPQRYPHKRLRLDVRRIARWRGSVKGLDGQALAWVPPHKLSSYAMPDADRPVVAALRDPDRYLVTPEPGDDDAAWLSSLRASLDRGVRRVQLRARTLESNARDIQRWRSLVERAVEACRAYDGTDVLINGDIALANELGIGVHLRSTQSMALTTRPLPLSRIVIASCHSPEELQHAQSLACDAVVLGPVFETASHPGMQGIGWNAFAAMREFAAIPIYAIGGLSEIHIPESREHGAQGVAGIRGLWSKETHD
ncbi:MAG: Nudix family hydrolase [Lysobacter sp.]|nr:Nudix family hydrolase [Lysobacter sp.]